jgi:microsomal dipeptidase-like Zn-dependent dipeptidase
MTRTLRIARFWGVSLLLGSLSAWGQGPASVSSEFLLNPGFEQGLEGWSAEGEAFSFQPTLGENVVASRVLQLPVGGDYWREVVYPIGVVGRRWVGTYERRPDATTERGGVQGDLPTGTLLSSPFRLTKPFLSFLIAGALDSARIRVELLAVEGESEGGGEVPRVLKSATGHGSEKFRREIWNVSEWQGRRVQLRLVDRSSEAGGHLSFDDVRESTVHPAESEPPLVALHEGVYVDRSSPVWGFVDLHTHPMSHLGFGGALIHGAPDGDIRKELGDCNCTHGGWGVDNRCGNTMRMALMSQVDSENVHLQGSFGLDHDHAGYPSFRTWPHFSTVVHQQMWFEWLKRAWQGGLRTLVALAVNNHLLAEGLDGGLPRDDRASADLQIEAMKEFVKRHSDFLAIASGPDELRDIVRAGKLAIILGIEVDNIGNFNFRDADRSESAVHAEIRRLYAAGVRYIFPIHLTDNPFGGAALYRDLFNTAQRFNEVQPLPADDRLWKPGRGFEIESASEESQIRFRLSPPLDTDTVRKVKLAVRFAEAFPFPFARLRKPTLGGFFGREREYQILKRFFLTESEIPSIPGGHRNARGLTALGRSAIEEMMRLGMLIDIDHMSQYAADETIRMAKETVPGGYPLFSGHNGFRALGVENENGRTEEQLKDLRELGGVMGVGYEYARYGAEGVLVDTVLQKQGVARRTRSKIVPNCGGTAKTFAQSYLYAVEKLGVVAFGTDVNGIVKGPGPRFGGESRLRGNHCPPEQQERPVRYAPRSGTGHWEGPNLPMIPLRTGNRTWDVNVNGVPHYGLLPDFLQDLRNVGMEPVDLDPLFQGSEAVARSWDRSVRASRWVRSGLH